MKTNLLIMLLAVAAVAVMTYFMFRKSDEQLAREHRAHCQLLLAGDGTEKGSYEKECQP